MGQTGLLFGAFDPINNGIIRIASHVLASGQVSQVTLIPCHLPHNRPVASLQSRLEMACLAVRGVPGISVSPVGIPDIMDFLSSLPDPEKKEDQDIPDVLIFNSGDLAALVDLAGIKSLLGKYSILIIPCQGSNALILAQKVSGMGARVRVSDITYEQSDGCEIRSMVASFDDPPCLTPDVVEYIALHGLYVPDYAPWVKTMLSARRYVHTLGVRDTAVLLGRRYGAPLIRSAVAGLLHDCAKDMPLGEMRAVVQSDTAVSPDMLASAALLHGPAGAAVVKMVLGLHDPQILSAISCHTVGRTGMTLLDLCLFVADAIEPGRKEYPGLDKIRSLAETDLHRAALMSMQCTRAYVLKKGEPYSMSAVSAMQDLINHIQGGKIMAVQTLVQRIASILYEKKAQDIKAFQVDHMTVITEFMVIANGRNAIQVRALAEEVEEKLALEGTTLVKREGQTSARWMILDYGTVLVHIFQPEDRAFYRLERLWDDGGNMIIFPFKEEETPAPFLE